MGGEETEGSQSEGVASGVGVATLFLRLSSFANNKHQSATVGNTEKERSLPTNCNFPERRSTTLTPNNPIKLGVALQRTKLDMSEEY